MSEKSQGQKMLDALSYSKKNIFEEASSEKIKEIYEYSKGYVAYLDKSKTEREATLEAIKLLEESGEKFDFKPFWGCDLQTEHERYLCEKVFKKPVFVITYPREIKAFYMRLNDDGKTVAAMDLLVPGVGEIIGGSQREERLDVLLSRMKELNLSEEDYWWYVNLRKYGGTKHAGYGLGFERILMYVTGVSNIRDVLPFPRTVGNAEF